MKLEFEGRTIHDVIRQMEHMLLDISLRKNNQDAVSEKHEPPAPESTAAAQGPGPGPVPKDNVPVDKAGEKPGDKPGETPGQARARKMREAKNAKAAQAPPAPAPKPEEPPQPEDPTADDPAEIIKLRQETIEALQAAYADGHQKEVFELLSRFGNGAKSFRELPPKAFRPIREAIDKGALT